MPDTKAERTRVLLDSVLRRMLEVDARNGIEAVRNGTTLGGEDTAKAIGERVLEDMAYAFGLDAGELFGLAQSHGALQADATLAALRLRIDATGLELMRGTTCGGILTGIRIGLLIADATAREERAKGFVRPVRRTYVHTTCGSTTTMSQAIAETYARDPSFYWATFCCRCQKHRPHDEFVWDDDGSRVGS